MESFSKQDWANALKGENEPLSGKRAVTLDEIPLAPPPSPSMSLGARRTKSEGDIATVQVEPGLGTNLLSGDETVTSSCDTLFFPIEDAPQLPPVLIRAWRAIFGRMGRFQSLMALAGFIFTSFLVFLVIIAHRGERAA